MEVASSERDLIKREWCLRVVRIDPSIVEVVRGVYIPYGLSRTPPSVLLLRKATHE